jgi:glucans biosynthesis protein
MFQYGENDRRADNDWRPEIHDSDGLAMQRGNGEWLWRPLTNPPRLHFSSYADENPRGFGLMQRDRDFKHYQDDSMFYESRPSAWVEPKGNWGKGSVQLIELTAPDETFDNIVAYWNPAVAAKPGQEMLYSYRLHWSGAPDVQTPLAHVVSTYTGPGGLIGQNIVGKRRDFVSWRFVVDFNGGTLPNHHAGGIHPIINASRGGIDLVSLHWIEETNNWRTQFDFRPDDGEAPTELRLVLQDDQGNPLSETWLYQWSPPPRP